MYYLLIENYFNRYIIIQADAWHADITFSIIIVIRVQLFVIEFKLNIPNYYSYNHGTYSMTRSLKINYTYWSVSSLILTFFKITYTYFRLYRLTVHLTQTYSPRIHGEVLRAINYTTYYRKHQFESRAWSYTVKDVGTYLYIYIFYMHTVVNFRRTFRTRIMSVHR